MAKWIESCQVKGSGNTVYTVSRDKDGNYGCSCPAWKFRRLQCKHIEQVKENLLLCAAKPDTKELLPAYPGNVGEVTVYADKILYPLVPLGQPFSPHLTATIIFDLLRAGAGIEQVKDYKRRMLPVSFTIIDGHIRENGRLIYTRWEKNIGWCELATVPADTPLKQSQ